MDYFGELRCAQQQGLATIRGTHGTSTLGWAAIARNGFRISEEKDCSNSYQWLGTGIYFFENDRNGALGWAKYRAQTDGDQYRPVVLMAVLACEEQRFFDLNNPKQFAHYSEYYKASELDAAKHVQNGDKIDGLLLELLCKELDVAIMRACLNTVDKLPLQPIGPLSRLIDGMQVQICVRDAACIKALVDSREIENHELVC